jgi:hypothetical protein
VCVCLDCGPQRLWQGVHIILVQGRENVPGYPGRFMKMVYENVPGYAGQLMKIVYENGPDYAE